MKCCESCIYGTGTGKVCETCIGSNYEKSYNLENDNSTYKKEEE